MVPFKQLFCGILGGGATEGPRGLVLNQTSKVESNDCINQEKSENMEIFSGENKVQITGQNGLFLLLK